MFLRGGTISTLKAAYNILKETRRINLAVNLEITVRSFKLYKAHLNFSGSDTFDVVIFKAMKDRPEFQKLKSIKKGTKLRVSEIQKLRITSNHGIHFVVNPTKVEIVGENGTISRDIRRLHNIPRVLRKLPSRISDSTVSSGSTVASGSPVASGSTVADTNVTDDDYTDDDDGGDGDDDDDQADRVQAMQVEQDENPRTPLHSERNRSQRLQSPVTLHQGETTPRPRHLIFLDEYI